MDISEITKKIDVTIMNVLSGRIFNDWNDCSRANFARIPIVELAHG